MTNSLVLTEFKVKDYYGETVCQAAMKGRGGETSQDPARLVFPCGLVITQRLAQEMDQGFVNQINRVHLRHHQLGHVKGLEGETWYVTATAKYENKDDPGELTGTHATCSDMEAA